MVARQRGRTGLGPCRQASNAQCPEWFVRRLTERSVQRIGGFDGWNETRSGPRKELLAHAAKAEGIDRQMER
jgi:hypothetical protein